MQLGDGTAYGISGWGNGELECYTSSTANVAIVPDPADATNGLLNITAVYKQGQTCYNGAVSKLLCTCCTSDKCVPAVHHGPFMAVLCEVLM